MCVGMSADDAWQPGATALLVGVARIEPRAVRFAKADAERAVLHLLWSAAEDDVPVRTVLFQLRSRDGPEIHHDRFQHLAFSAIPHDDTVAIVGWMPLDQHLGSDEPVAGFADREVNMRAAECSLECVLDRLDGAEEVLAFGISYKPAVALEVGVVPAGVAAAGVQIGAVGVRLPDFDIAVAKRFARFRQHAAGNVA